MLAHGTSWRPLMIFGDVTRPSYQQFPWDSPLFLVRAFLLCESQIVTTFPLQTWVVVGEQWGEHQGKLGGGSMSWFQVDGEGGRRQRQWWGSFENEDLNRGHRWWMKMWPSDRQLPWDSPIIGERVLILWVINRDHIFSPPDLRGASIQGWRSWARCESEE